jgi:ABC-type phosphate transport system permease subunit
LLAMNRRPQLTIVAPSASPEEAAAVVAALERFMRETAPVIVTEPQRIDRWTRTALLEGVAREDELPAAWGDPHPWQR